MQLPIPADVLVLLAVGVVVVLIALIVIIARARRRRTAQAPWSDQTAEPVTDERESPVDEEPPDAESVVDPHNVLSEPWPSAPGDAPTDAAPAVGDGSPAGPVPAAGTGPAGTGAADTGDGSEPAVGRPLLARPDTAGSTSGGSTSGGFNSDDGAPGRAGSSPTVALALAQALAVRSAGGRSGQMEPAFEGSSSAELRGDVRDRLLAVLLDDPARALGAAAELETCRGQLERLSDAVRQERAKLSDLLERLAGAGLRPDQLARLAGITVDEVRALLARATSHAS